MKIIHYGSLAAETGWPAYSTYRVRKCRLDCRIIMPQLKPDEHIVLTSGTTMELNYADHNLNDLFRWTLKHINYAVREAANLPAFLSGIMVLDDGRCQNF